MFGLCRAAVFIGEPYSGGRKTTGCAQIDVPCHLSPGPWVVGRKIDFGTAAEGAWNVHAGSVRPRLDEACRTTDGQRRWSSGIGSYRRVSSQSDCSGGSSGEVRDLYMRNASVGIEGMG